MVVVTCRQPNTARTFKNDILDGPMVSWYDDGQTKLYAVTYKANKKEGMATGYYQDGKKKYEICERRNSKAVLLYILENRFLSSK